MTDTPAPAKTPFAARVLDWSDERRAGDGIIITLAAGWAFEPSEDENAACHVRGFDTVTEAKAFAKLAKPCTCGRCVKLAADAAPADAAPVVTLDVDHKGKPSRTRNLSGQGGYHFAAHANVDHKGKGYRAAIYQTGYRIPAATVDVTLYLNGRAIPEAHLAAVRAAVVTAYNAAFINAPLTILPGTVEFLRGGMGARRTHGRVTLAVEGDEFVLSAPDATPHRLAISQTPATRLDAHWQAYCEAHSEAPAADETPAPAPKAEARVVGSIDMTPTWEETAAMLFTIIERGDTTGRAHALKELQRMGRLADIAMIVMGGHRRDDAPAPIAPADLLGKAVTLIQNAGGDDLAAAMLHRSTETARRAEWLRQSAKL